MRRGRAAVTGIALAVVAAACSPSGDGAADRPDPDTAVSPDAQPAEFAGHGSVQEAYVLGAEPGEELRLVDAEGEVVATGEANELGGMVLRGVEPGEGYTVRAGDGDDEVTSDRLTVLAPDEHPDPDLYRDQTLEPGLNYVTVRDGVELAVAVRLPAGAESLDDGPFPTVIEYSGYGVAAPGDLLAEVDGDGLDPDGLPPPESPTAVGSALAPLLGFASVSVQMRGTGCSGGAFGLFDTLAALDGYDAVETVAAQDWVQGGRVGMVGISYSGISQLLVAGAQPPSLAAITPLSVTDDLYAVGFPGGLVNSGFAASWMAERVEDAKPAHRGGQPWAQAMIELLGDDRCDANQALHDQAKTPAEVFAGGRRDVPAPYDQLLDIGWEELLESEDLLPLGLPRFPEGFEERSPLRWAEQVEVPVFLAGALQDEQTGGSWTNLVPALDGNENVWVSLVNGTHIDSVGPGTAGRMVEFLDLFVAEELPSFNDHVTELAPALYDFAAAAPAGPLDPLRFTDAPSLDAARLGLEEDPRVRLLFDNGGGDPEPGALAPQWEAAFDQWPPAEVVPTPYYLGEDGTLGDAPPAQASDVSYRPDAAARPAGSLPDGDLEDPWEALPPYDWAPVTDGAGLGFVTEPLDEDVVLTGPASVDLSLSSSADDADLQVTLSEVRPDGQEMFLQSGVLRASHRRLDDERSTELLPVPTFAPEDAEPLPADEVTTVRVPLTPLGHAVRAGSSLRLTITAPGGELSRWRFATPDAGGDVSNTVVLGGDEPSRVVLPVMPDVRAEGERPPCPSLRGQPCRPYTPAPNGG